MTNSSSNSFQSLGNGGFRVSGARISPTTGRYVTRSSASVGKSAASPSQPKTQPTPK
ncbi:hypothetical protein EDF22_3605 [Rathayibacter sp. PhB127]|uniref:hypothetical protein n=1 Tax=Rathayibacter sp. PhB127 TaxID=2485176 RepID=UPI000FBFC1EB|nr:hypothetical protein [Rathayibacter sp. PhB127]ROS22099.1 hypothetical protein EDF22_3605 [Rathayibacter sp. PhB127]